MTGNSGSSTRTRKAKAARAQQRAARTEHMTNLATAAERRAELVARMRAKIQGQQQ